MLMRQVVMKMASAIFHIYISYFFSFCFVVVAAVWCGNNKITHKKEKK